MPRHASHALMHQMHPCIALQAIGLKWIEEPLMPDDYQAHTDLARKMEGMGCTAYLATGEHEYTVSGYHQLIKAGVGLIQPDVMWMGGPTEFIKVVALAQANGTAVVPHGCGVYGYYMAMAFGHIPCCEFMMMSEQGDKIEPNFGSVFKNEPLPEDGYISLSDAPGFGLELNREHLNLVRPFDRAAEAAGVGGEPEAKRSKGD